MTDQKNKLTNDIMFRNLHNSRYGALGKNQSDVGMSDINLKQRYKFSNPSSLIKGAHEETTATAEQIINHMKSLNDDRYKDATDLQLLDEFIVIHWAEKVGE